MKTTILRPDGSVDVAIGPPRFVLQWWQELLKRGSRGFPGSRRTAIMKKWKPATGHKVEVYDGEDDLISVEYTGPQICFD